MEAYIISPFNLPILFMQTLNGIGMTVTYHLFREAFMDFP